MVSDEGLNAYGAVTWGQFFIYQGFNDRAGWMHTSSGVDDIDEYLETVVKKGDGFFYRYGDRRAAGDDDRRSPCPTRRPPGWPGRTFTVYRTASRARSSARLNGKWVSVRLMQEPLKALTQSYTRTKARNYKAFRQTMELHTNSSNNTIFADADGNIAYFHANFIPKRDTQLRLDEARGRQRPGDRVARAALGRRDAAPAEPGERLALQHATTGRGRRPGRAARRRRTIPRTSRPASSESPRGVHAHPGPARTRRTSRSTR